MQIDTSCVPSCGYHAVGSRNSMSTLIFWWFAFEHAPQFCSTFSATFMIETLRICFFGPIHLPQFQINRIWLLLSKILKDSQIDFSYVAVELIRLFLSVEIQPIIQPLNNGQIKWVHELRSGNCLILSSVSKLYCSADCCWASWYSKSLKSFCACFE